MKKKVFFILCVIIIGFLFDKQIIHFKNYLIGNYPIMDNGRSSEKQLAAFLLKHNSHISGKLANALASTYIQEAKAEGVNWDIAFCQMCVETDYFKFGGAVKKNQNNFAGIGAIDNGAKGASFDTPEEGIKAQIQHLKAYASTAPLHNKIVDPRFKYVRRGSAEYLFGLGDGNWASDPNYADKISNLLAQLHSMEH